MPGSNKEHTVAHFSVVTPCYNEQENVRELHAQIEAEFAKLPQHTYEHIYIDNASTDATVALVKDLIREHSNVRLIVNARNFGHIRSPYHGVLQGSGDATILMASDLQDPPSLIPQFIEKWEAGFKIVKAVKTNAEETPLMFLIRKLFYGFINRLADIDLTKNYTGTGLYDKRIIAILKTIADPYPYFRGLISDIGFEFAAVEFHQPTRKRGITKNNFYTLYDMAMLGITNHTKIPLRMATLAGFALGAISLFLAALFFLLKLIFWDRFQAGMAPILLGMFFFSSVQLFFLGILGEYIGNIYTQVQKRPHVFEKERVNFPSQNSQ
jgi:glycosyltransferase involved in cell wall biosynthesis